MDDIIIATPDSMENIRAKVKEVGYNPDEIEIVIMDDKTGTIMEISPVANSQSNHKTFNSRRSHDE
ncbi:MAG: flagellar basal body P-ring protein FlgI [Gammaproteobacteria bacterium]|nr:flagellar basal body P-ring protein FlgI [Gammaproteobacteria bacterium]